MIISLTKEEADLIMDEIQTRCCGCGCCCDGDHEAGKKAQEIFSKAVKEAK